MHCDASKCAQAVRCKGLHHHESGTCAAVKVWLSGGLRVLNFTANITHTVNWCFRESLEVTLLITLEHQRGALAVSW